MTNSLLNRTGSFVALNKSGDHLDRGAVAVLGGTAENLAISTVTTSGYKDSSIVVVVEPGGIDDDAYGMVAIAITVPQLNLDGDADLFDFVKTSTVAGQGTPHAGPPEAGDFAQVIDLGNDPAAPAAILLGFPVQDGGTVIEALKTIWHPDAPPASPSALDDEFDDGSLDVKWTELDFGSKLTVTESSIYNHLILSSLPSSGYSIAGLSQALPAGDFTVAMKLDLRGISASSMECGIALWENQLSSSDIFTLSARRENTRVVALYAYHFTNYLTDVIGSGYNIAAIAAEQAVYLRLRRNGSNYYQDWSLNGLSWDTYSAAHNPSFTPGYVGVFNNNTPSSVTRESSVHFFRYLNSDIGSQGILAGRLAGIYE
jgi:hypothetical protein